MCCRTLSGGDRFAGTISYGDETARWLGVRGGGATSDFDLSPVLESGQCQPIPQLMFDGYTAVDVGSSHHISMGGWQPFTVEAWVCPVAPDVPLPSTLEETNTLGPVVVQTIFSKVRHPALTRTSALAGGGARATVARVLCRCVLPHD